MPYVIVGQTDDRRFQIFGTRVQARAFLKKETAEHVMKRFEVDYPHITFEVAEVWAIEGMLKEDYIFDIK